MIMVRYADDLVVGFQHESDARRFWDAIRDRLREFSLSLHPDKTRLIGFGRFGANRRPSSSLASCSFAINLDEATSESGGSHVATACVRSSGKSRRSCASEQTGRSLKRENGLRKSSPDISPITPCRPWPGESASDITSNIFGIGSYVDVAIGQECYERRCRNRWTSFSRSRRFFIRGPPCGSPSNTRGGSRVPELGSRGSVRGALRNERPYRECEKRMPLVTVANLRRRKPIGRVCLFFCRADSVSRV